MAALVLSAVAAALLSPALLPGRILAPVDLVFETPGYASERPDGFVEPANPHLFDQVYQFVPWRHYAWHNLRDGRLPLWNPLSATGTPFVATMQAGVFYPLNLLMLPLPFAATFVASALARLWIAGFTTYLLLRRYGSSHMAGLLSGASFMLSGFIVAWLGHPHTNVAVWLPALILAIEGLIAAREQAARMRWWAALAAVTGIQILGGHVETSFDLLLAGALYATVRLAQRRDLALKQRAGKLLEVGTGVLAGAGIAAIQLAPFIEWLPLSAEFERRSGLDLLVWSGDLRQLFTLPLAALPNLYGNPTWDGPYWSFNPWGSFNEGVLYAGVVPLGLAIGALAVLRADPIARAWAITGGVALGLALRVPLLDWFNQLPGIALSHPGRLRLIAIFAVAVLAGLGLDRLIADAGDPRTARWMSRAMMAIIAVASAIAIAGGVALQINPDWGVDALRYVVDRLGSGDAPPRSVLVCRERVETCGQQIVAAFALTNWRMHLPLIAACTALLALELARRRPHFRVRLAPALIGIAVVDLLLTGHGYNPAVPTAQLFPAGAAIEALVNERPDGRVTALQQDTLPDAHMMHGLSEVRGLDFKTARYEAYLDASGDRIPWIANGVLLSSAGPLIAALDIQTVITTNPHIVAREESSGAMRVNASYGDLTLLEPVERAGRAEMRYEVALASDDFDASHLLAEQPERIFNRVVLPDSEDTRWLQEAMSGGDPSPRVEAVVLEAERLVWEVETSAPGVLVVADAYYPGWTAAVDGAPVEIMRANIAFRAVELPAGTHVVEMRYQPRSIRIGAAVSAVSIAAVFATAVLPLFPAFRRRA